MPLAVKHQCKLGKVLNVTKMNIQLKVLNSKSPLQVIQYRS